MAKRIAEVPSKAEFDTASSRSSSENGASRIRIILSQAVSYVVMRYLGLRQMAFLQEARGLAMHLEHEVFPMLRSGNERWLVLRVDSTGNAALQGEAGNRRIAFDGCGVLQRSITQAGVSAVRLDTQLEYGQVVEALLLLIHAAPQLPAATPSDGEYRGWRRQRLADRLVSERGLHRFCTLMRYDPASQRFEVEYYYCELFLSRAVKNYIERRSTLADHRFLFRAAPRVALLTFLLLVLPAVVFHWSPIAAEALWLVAAIGCAVAFGTYTYALGAFLYSHEHHDQLLQNYVDQVRQLSRFPEANPNPVVELQPDGAVLYENPAARALAGAASILPQDRQVLVQRSLEAPGEAITTETRRDGRTFTFSFSAFPGEQSVIAAGQDVTYMKQIESELRALNQDIQQKNGELEQAYALVDRELDVVGEIQQTLLPQGLPKIPGLDLAAHYATSQKAGGDYYDFFPLPDGQWGILIADVSGHGAPAAVLMAITHAIAHHFQDHEHPSSPGLLLRYINQALSRRYTGRSGHFVTAFYAIYDPATAALRYASAGHNPPRLWTAAGPIQELDRAPGLPLGVDANARFEEGVAQLAPGDVIVLYTDGITEAMNAQRELFGVERLDQALDGQARSPARIRDSVLTELDAFAAGVRHEDDQTLVIACAQ